MKILFLTAMHERYTVSELFCIGLQRLFKDAPSDIELMAGAIVSDSTSFNLCRRYGIEPVIKQNRPLGRKWNSGLEHFLYYSWDYVCIVGDDDLLASDLWKLYKPLLDNGTDYFGVRNEYFYHPATQEAVYFSYGDKEANNKLIGAPRLISRLAIEQAGWYSKVVFTQDFQHGYANYRRGDTAVVNTRYAIYLEQMKRVKIKYEPFFSLWKDGQERGLDNESEMGLIMNGFHPVPVYTQRPILIDVKTENNIWKFENFKGVGNKVPVKTATWFLSDVELNFINAHLGGLPV